MVQVVQVRVRPPRGYMDHVPSQPTFDMLTVLVVDDDRDLRESLCAFLRQRGCSVTAAAGGVEGLQAGIPDTFDVRSEKHTSEIQSQSKIVFRLFLLKKKKKQNSTVQEYSERAQVYISV